MTRHASTAPAGQGPRARPQVRQIQPYERESSPVAFALDDNTSAFGAPPAARRVLRQTGDDLVCRYPAPYSRALREAIATYAGVTPEAVVVGCGSDDVLDCTLRAFGAPGSTLAYMDPTFVMARLFGLTNALVPAAIPLTAAFEPDVAAFGARGGLVNYLCSPNNPTGTLVSHGAIQGVLRHAPGLVILDEAYAEYAGTSWAAEAAAGDRLLVLRTFSKAFGLAGLRVGYGIGNPAIVTEIEKVRGPYKVSAPAEQAALAVLREDLTWVRDRAAETVQLRERFTGALERLGMRPLPSAANFVLLPVADAANTARRLRERQIGVRPFVALTGVGDAIRITVRPWQVLETVLDALKEVVCAAP